MGDNFEQFLIEEQEPGLAIGRKIAVLRLLQDITQYDLAKKTGIPQPNISRIENGTYNPTIKLLQKIADGLDKKLEIDFK